MSAPSANVVTGLRALAKVDRPLMPFEIGGAIARDMKARGERTVGTRGSRYIGPGALASPVVGSLRKRGWARATPRADGLSGTAWVITAAGREALAELDSPTD